jgi:hypothetical protein
MNENKILLKAIDHFGKKHQIKKAIEELNELICIFNIFISRLLPPLTRI